MGASFGNTLQMYCNNGADRTIIKQNQGLGAYLGGAYLGGASAPPSWLPHIMDNELLLEGGEAPFAGIPIDRF